MTHTPTPWIKRETIIDSEQGDIIANFQHGGWEYTNSQENMKRIVECVNACEGMQDPAAEIAKLKARVAELEAGFPNQVYVITEDSGGAYSECKRTIGVFISEDKAFDFCRGKGGTTYDEIDLTK